MNKKVFTRYVIKENGKIVEIKIPEKKALRQIEERLEKDKKILEILEKL